MKISNRTLIEAVPALQKLMGLSDIPTKTSYRISKNGRKLDQELKDFQKTLKELQEKMSKKDGDGNILPRKDANGKEVPGSFEIDDLKAFEKEYEGLLDEQTDDLEINKISVAELDGVKVEPSIYMLLDFMFTD